MLFNAKTSIRFLSNLLIFVSDFFNSTSPESPFSPKIVTKTLASVPFKWYYN